MGCSSLTSVTIPDSVTSIGKDAFFCCHKLVEVINKSTLGISKGSEGNGYVACYALYVHNGTSKIVNQDGFLFITDEDNVNYLLGYEGTATELTLPNDYNGKDYEIYQYAFYGCRSLTSVTIGNSVTSIGYEAFYGCSSLKSVYYKGTESEWNKISINAKNTYLTSATRYYYSETKPTTSGNYWHYDESGNITVW